MTTLLIALLAIISIAIYWYILMTKYKLRLRKKDILIETLFAGLPHLFCKSPNDIAYSIQCEPEFNSRFIKVRYYCNDLESRCRLFAYFTWLKEHGLPIIPEDMKPRIEPCTMVLDPEDIKDERRAFGT